MMKNKELEIGDKVWIIDDKLQIIEKQIYEIVKVVNSDGVLITKYKLNANSCGSIFFKDLFIKRSLAEYKLKTYLDEMNYRIGDIVIVKENRTTYLGRISSYRNDGLNSYNVIYLSEYSSNNIIACNDKMITKVKNNYIENFEDIKDIIEELKEIERNYNIKYEELKNIHVKLEHDLKNKFSNYSGWSFFNKSKKSKKFENIFVLNKSDEE